jgi:8-oxo-dGTP pyrophosphatase MutT (NUDIX family)
MLATRVPRVGRRRSYHRLVPRHLPARRRLTTVAETSAGGLVVEPKDGSASGGDPRVALIAHRNQRGTLEWVLPKGHLEAGESAEQAAVREVEEETGIRGRVVAPLGSVDYWFVDHGRRVHKTVHHFLLEGVSGTLRPDTAEVEQVEWVPLRSAAARLTHADERALVERAGRLLADPA